MTTLATERPLDIDFNFAGARPRLAMNLFILAVVLTALAGRFAYLVKPFNPDSAMFIYLGKSVCDGDRFAHDVTDNKFPSVGLMTSAAWRAFGTHWPAYIALQTAMTAFAAWLLSRCAARVAGEHARLPTLLAAIVYLNFSLAVFGGFQLETLQTFFAVIAACGAIYALGSRSFADAFVIGLAAGCAAMLKPTGLAPLGGFAVVLVLSRRPVATVLKQLCAAGLGLSVPFAVVVVYLIRFDILSDIPDLYRQISRYASATPLDWEDIFKPFTILILAGFGLLTRGWIFRRRAIKTEHALPSAVLGFAIAWLVLELLGAMLQRRMYAYHFLPVAAPAALLFGLIPRENTSKLMLASLGPIMLLSLLGSLEVLKYPDPRMPLLPHSAYLLEHADKDDLVWQDCMPRLLLETGLRPGARYPLMFVFGNHDSAALEYTPVLLEDFERRRPRWIILPTRVEEEIAVQTRYCAHLSRSPARAENFAKAWRAVEAYVKQNYVVETRIRGDTVYCRR